MSGEVIRDSPASFEDYFSQATLFYTSLSQVEQEHVTKALAGLGRQARYNQLRQQVMEQAECSKRTAQLAIGQACREGWIVQLDGHYRLPV